jgi:hypothetical protein
LGNIRARFAGTGAMTNLAVFAFSRENLAEIENEEM